MIELRNITKTYNSGTDNEVKIFKKFNLKIDKGEFVSVVGSNGSGKTSLLNCICGDIKLDEGSIFINDIDITRLQNYQRYKYIGRVYQNPANGTCQDMTILENIALADNKGKKFNLMKCINKKRLGFYKEKLSELGLGLENKLNTKVSSLSGGQRQAVALIMSTITPIDVLILDEHTAALDAKTAKIIMKLTDRIVRENNLTTIMVTHNLKYAVQYGNRIIALRDGKIKLDINGKNKSKVTNTEILDVFEEEKIFDKIYDSII